MTTLQCPSCGAEMSLDVCLSHEELKLAYLEMFKVTAPLPAQILRYINLFRPSKTKMRPARFGKLAGEVLVDIQAESIHFNGRDWEAPLAVWRAGFEAVQARAEDGKLGLPLSNHNYLYKIIADLSDKAESLAEKEQEIERRHPKRSGANTGFANVAQVLGAGGAGQHYALDPAIKKIINHTGDPMPEGIKQKLKQFKGTKND